MRYIALQEKEESTAILLFCQEEENSMEPYDAEKCLHAESGAAHSSCPTREFRLQKNCRDCSAKSTHSSSPALPGRSHCFASSFLAVKSERSSRRSNGISAPLSPSAAEEERGLIKSSKSIKAESDHKKENKQTNPCSMLTKNVTFLTAAVKSFRAGIYNQMYSNISEP